VKTYPTDRIRTVALVGHGHVGKTSLAEALLHAAGVITRAGTTTDGNTVTDFDPDEIDKQISIHLATAPLEWKGYKINLIDAPGYADFFGDAEAALHAADAALIVVSAVDGLQVQARAAWDVCERLELPRAIFINKCDRERADVEATLAQLTEAFGTKVAPVHLPIGKEHDFKGVVDLLNELEITYEGGKATSGPLPEHHAEEIDKLHERLVDSVVEADDDMMERYLAGETIAPKEVIEGMHKAVAAGSAVPVLCGSATAAIAIDLLADFITEELPAPGEGRAHPATKGGAEVELTPDPSGPLAVQVYKTLSDPYVGRISYVKVLSGTLKPDSTVFNPRTKTDERISTVFSLRGKTQDPLTEIAAGDIGAVGKLAETLTGDTLTTHADDIVVPPIHFPDPVFALAIEPKTKGDEDKLSTALAKVIAEDPSFHWERNAETHQTVISGMGETHLDVIVQRLARNHVEVTTFPPRVSYKETIRGTARADGQLKKQTGGRGQFARCSIEISPQPRGAGYEFEDAIVGGAIPHNFIPSVDKGVQKSMEAGPLAGYPFVDFKVKLYDGKYHDVDSSDIAFQIAAGMALKEAADKAGLVLLEPIGELTVIIPDESVGDIMGDLSSRRGRIEGTEAAAKGWTRVKGHVPMGEMLRYAIDLRSKTGGRGSFSLSFSHYDEAPPHVQEKIVAEHAKEKEAAEKK
jgi:elongation factor G